MDVSRQSAAKRGIFGVHFHAWKAVAEARPVPEVVPAAKKGDSKKKKRKRG